MLTPSDRTFSGQNSYKDGDRTVCRWYHLPYTGDYALRFRIVSTNSNHRQGIGLYFSRTEGDVFRGSLMLNGQPLPVPRKLFQHYTFKEGEIPADGFTLSVRAEEGHLILANESEELPGLFTSGALGCALFAEPLSDSILRFHCNDHEYDGDFDDLIFDMEVFQS